ncbi:hypothetical protein [Absidia glauca]|uniref:PSP1 C-terminal domain-containing protein n=1 Tax=Absidia glauca TaxID=4829 RepID=A0A163JNX0_ABSGL|nr:hypothetical protein [Absidia glauca]
MGDTDMATVLLPMDLLQDDVLAVNHPLPRKSLDGQPKTTASSPCSIFSTLSASSLEVSSLAPPNKSTGYPFWTDTHSTIWSPVDLLSNDWNAPPLTTDRYDPSSFDTRTTRHQQQYGLNKEVLAQIDAYFSGTPSHVSNTFMTTPLLYVVQFKHNRTELCYVVEETNAVAVGDWVIVEADRGRDLGRVIEQITHHQQRGIKQLYRRASLDEIATLDRQRLDEEKALMVCQAKIQQRNLPMQIVHAEYQWDRRKLTFYFVANQRVDFRQAVRELFKTYKTRIWMCALKAVDGS